MDPYYSLIDFNIILLAFAKKTVEFSILMMAGRELQCFSGEYSNDCSVFGLLRYSLPEDIPLVFLSFSSEMRCSLWWRYVDPPLRMHLCAAFSA